MSTIARRFASVPSRTASETWRAVTNLLANQDELEHFQAALNAAAVLIADEVTKSLPFVLVGAGPRVHIYTVHGEDSVNGHGTNESAVALSYSDNWVLYVPDHPDEPGLVTSLIDDPHVEVGKPPTSVAAATASPKSRVQGFDLASLESS